MFGVLALLAGPPPTELPLFPLVPDLPRPPPLPIDLVAAVVLPLVPGPVPLMAGLVPLVPGLVPLVAELIPLTAGMVPLTAGLVPLPLTGALLLLCAGNDPQT